MKLSIVISTFGLAFLPLAANAALSQVLYENTNVTVKNVNGITPLTAGTAINGDGAIIQIGYFTGGTNTFAGTWMAISGLGSMNPTLLTSVGDGGAPDGLFSGSTVFDDVVHSSLPAGGTQLAMRFYNGTTIANSTHYNTVTSSAASWQFKAPATPAALPASLNMDAGSLTWQGGAGTAFTTAILIPEPATAMLGLLGGLLLLRRRRG